MNLSMLFPAKVFLTDGIGVLVVLGLIVYVRFRAW